MRVSVFGLILVAASCFTVACAGVEQAADAPYKRMLVDYCQFLTPTLVTPKLDRHEGWKCKAGVDDYNRLFSVDITVVEMPGDGKDADLR